MCDKYVIEKTNSKCKELIGLLARPMFPSVRVNVLMSVFVCVCVCVRVCLCV